ncbi:MAG: putative DNA modification/repair radical SAM protein [Bdellovibrionota bacterium]
MKISEKLPILADAAKYDASCASSGGKRDRAKGGIGNVTGAGICHSYTPDGRCVSLLKILLTNYCIYDCLFCLNRVSSDTPRARFTVEEVVSLTMSFYKRNYIEGLFLSSGIIQSSDYTMEQLVRVARTLRKDHLFNGYIHLKAIPGCSSELLDEAGRYADRLSANIELPSQGELNKLAPAKNQSVIQGSMAHLNERIQAAQPGKRSQDRPAPKFAGAGQSTQFIVGATDASDKTILSKATDLYKSYGLRRIYYSAFSPIQHGSSILPFTRAPLEREHRLYQADWLYRFYGFGLDDIFSGRSEQLDLSIDPKIAWAIAHRHLFPIDVNTAPRELLLKVPGFGVRTVQRLLAIRRQKRIRFEDLHRLNIPLSRARLFLEVSNYRPNSRLLEAENLRSLLVPPKQLSMFEDVRSVVSGEL